MNPNAIDPIPLADSLVTEGGPPTSSGVGSPTYSRRLNRHPYG